MTRWSASASLILQQNEWENNISNNLSTCFIMKKSTNGKSYGSICDPNTSGVHKCLLYVSTPKEAKYVLDE